MFAAVQRVGIIKTFAPCKFTLDNWRVIENASMSFAGLDDGQASIAREIIRKKARRAAQPRALSWLPQHRAALQFPRKPLLCPHMCWVPLFVVMLPPPPRPIRHHAHPQPLQVITRCQNVRSGLVTHCRTIGVKHYNKDDPEARFQEEIGRQPGSETRIAVPLTPPPTVRDWPSLCLSRLSAPSHETSTNHAHHHLSSGPA